MPTGFWYENVKEISALMLEDNTKVDLKEIVVELQSIHPVQDKDGQGCFEYSIEHLFSIKCG
jgi:hypothetical protein